MQYVQILKFTFPGFFSLQSQRLGSHEYVESSLQSISFTI